MDTEFFNQPRVQPYDPMPVASGEITVAVEWQRQDRDNWRLGVVETERTGRVRIVIEGEGERVRPYLDAVYQVVAIEERRSE